MLRIPSLLFLVLLFDSFSPVMAGSRPTLDFESWLKWEKQVATQELLTNVSPRGALLGVVIASPSTQDPDYYFHWTRDAALTMDVVVSLYERSTSQEQKSYYRKLILNYIEFSRSNQDAPALTGLGEPKFHVNGLPFSDPWGRPQDDGPALRALTLIHLARVLMLEGGADELLRQLYDNKFPSKSIIKRDLEYIAKYWTQTSFDLWEEARGHHFYTALVQRSALKHGAELAVAFGDDGAARWYLAQADGLTNTIPAHWNPSRRFVVATLDQNAGIGDKYSGLDTSIILAALHAQNHDGFFSVTNDRVLSTAYALECAFAQIYPVNRNSNAPALGIGRYPEDRYFGGNPWFLTTLAFAELYQSVAMELLLQGKIILTEWNFGWFSQAVDHLPALALSRVLAHGQMIVDRDNPLFEKIIRGLRKRGDDFLARVRFHVDETGSMSEQFSRYNGLMLSARDLTWSYAAFMTALWARESNRW